MRTARSYKIISLLIAMALSFTACIFCCFEKIDASAKTPSVASEYFVGDVKGVEFVNDSVKATLENEGSVELTSSLALDDLGFEIKTEQNLQKLSVKFSTDSYYANGNVDGEELVSKVRHELSITISGSSLALEFNGVNASASLSGNLNVNFKVSNNVVSAVVEGVTVKNTAKAYLVKDIDVCVAKDFAFQVAQLKDGEIETYLSFISIDQKVSDNSGAYKQTFALDTEGKIESLAMPVVSLSEDAYSNDGIIYVQKGYRTTVGINAYTVFGQLKNNELRISGNDVWTENVDTAKTFVFGEVGVKTLNVETTSAEYASTTLRTFNVTVYENDTNAPEYKTSLINSEEYKAYVKAVEEATKMVDDITGETVSIKIGDEYYVPSLKDLVEDDYTSYDKLKATLYYKTPSDESSSSTMEIEIEEPGDYMFYVSFSDASGNAMEREDFIAEGDDKNQIEFGKYGDFVFKFHVEDDSEFYIKADKETGTGYVGEYYVAPTFNIKAFNYTATYTLYYNSNVDAKSEDDGWVQIVKTSELTDKYENSVFTEEDVKEIEFDGKNTFTPDREGAYKLKCLIVSDNTNRSSEAEMLVKVVEPYNVHPYEPLTSREVLAIVFLGVGGLCLAGIIFLLVYKPKEKNSVEDDE